MLSVRDLSVAYRARGRVVQAVRNATLSIEAGRCLGLVGESGSGKSTIGGAVQGIIAADGSATASGEIEIAGRSLIPLTDPAWRLVRGREVTTVFQDPMRSLDPTMTIGRMLSRYTGSAAASVAALDQVQIRQAAQVLRRYPHQLSGGMRQRVMIALALARAPRLLVADEPTTALDVSVQADILRVLREAAQSAGCAVLFVTHDLGVARHMCDEIAVMKDGEIVETGTAEQVILDPQVAYTKRLMASRLTLQTDRDRPVGLPDEGVLASMADVLHVQGKPADGLEQRWLDGGLGWDDFVDDGRRRRMRRFALALNNITKSYTSWVRGTKVSQQVLTDVSLAIGHREAVALVGESGSGKSTTLRIAAGIEECDAGGVNRDGVGGEGVQVVFQDAGASLTPWRTVEQLLVERIANSAAGAGLSGPVVRRADQCS